jgi:hypothetical protein
MSNTIELRSHRYVAVRNIRATKSFLLWIAAACSAIQLLLDASLTNVTCALLAFLGTAITCVVSCTSDNFTKFPIATVNVLSYTICYLWIPLVAKTILIRENLDLNLHVPLQVFGYSFGLCVTMNLALILYRRSSSLQNYRKAASRLYLRVGVFRPVSSTTIWIISIAALVMTHHQVQSEVSDAVTFAYLTPLSYLPLAILFKIPSSAPKGVVMRGRLGVLFYFLALVVTSLLTNTRAVFIQPILMGSLALLLYYLMGKIYVTSDHRWKIAAGLILLALIYPISTRISRAELVTRKYRSSVDVLTLLRLTLEQASKEDSGSSEFAQDRYGYSENYFDSEGLNRLGNPKLEDNALTFANYTGQSGREALAKFEALDSLGGIPTPIRNLLNINVDVGYVFGQDVTDWLRHQYTGEKPASLTGSFMADGTLLFGWFFLPVMMLVWFFWFPLLDAFLIYKPELLKSTNATGDVVEVQSSFVGIVPVAFFPLCILICLMEFPVEAMAWYVTNLREVFEPLVIYLTLAWFLESFRKILLGVSTFSRLPMRALESDL